MILVASISPLKQLYESDSNFKMAILYGYIYIFSMLIATYLFMIAISSLAISSCSIVNYAPLFLGVALILSIRDYKSLVNCLYLFCAFRE